MGGWGTAAVVSAGGVPARPPAPSHLPGPPSGPSASSGHAVGPARSRRGGPVCSGFDKVISEAGPRAARGRASSRRGPPADAAPDGCPAVYLCLGTWFLLNLIASFSGLKSRVASKQGQRQFNLIARRWPSEGTVATGAHPGPAPPRTRPRPREGRSRGQGSGPSPPPPPSPSPLLAWAGKLPGPPHLPSPPTPQHPLGDG